MEAYINIGKATRTFGIHGELRVFIKDAYLDDFLETDVVFLEVRGKPTPFFVEEIRVVNDYLLKLEDIDSPEAAHPLCDQDLFMRSEDLRHAGGEAEPEAFTVEELTGYTIVEVNAGEIGVIEEVVELPQQWMAVVTYQEREILIPLHDDLLEEVDPDRQRLIMRLPTGLLEL